MKLATLLAIFTTYMATTSALPFNKVTCTSHVHCDLITRLIYYSTRDLRDAEAYKRANPSLFHEHADIVRHRHGST
jgi:hypothetical protein